jgi:streptomycin 6-kinase
VPQAVRLQPLVRARVEGMGAPGAEWVARLSDVVHDLCERWDLTPGRPLPGGSASYVLGVTTADGEPAALKVSLDDVTREAQVLSAAAGRGYALLLAHDVREQALLLERLGPSIGVDRGNPLRTLADTLALAWQVRPDDVAPDLPVTDKAAALALSVAEQWTALHRPCPQPVVEQALAYAGRLSAELDPARCVLVHGDPHVGNTLRVLEPRSGAPAGAVLVDPDGFVCDPAYDLGVTVRDGSAQLLRDPSSARETVLGWCRTVAERVDLDPWDVWRWGFLERVSTGLYVAAIGAPAVAEPFLRSAELLLDAA